MQFPKAFFLLLLPVTVFAGNKPDISQRMRCSLSTVLWHLENLNRSREASTSISQDFLNIQFTPEQNSKDSYGDLIRAIKNKVGDSDGDWEEDVRIRLRSLGWVAGPLANTAGITPLTYWGRIYEILKGNIQAPKTNWKYHGTSSNFLRSIASKGLDNGVSGEVNHGVMLHVAHGTTYLLDIEAAWGFSKTTTNKMGGNRTVIRWPTDKPMNKYGLGVESEPVPSARLEFSTDGGHSWRPITEYPKD